MSPTLLILAAGIGSRYGGLKQADGIGPSGEAILDYSIYDAIRAGFGKAIFVIRKDIEADMRRIFFDKWMHRIEIDHVYQEISDLPGGHFAPKDRTKPWGTAHAIWTARGKIREPFAVINADDFYGQESYQLASRFLGDIGNLLQGRYALIGYRLKNTLSEHGFVSRAECRIGEGNLLKGITERLKIRRDDGKVFYQDGEGRAVLLSENTMVSMNFWAFMPSLFDHIEKDMLDLLPGHSRSLTAEFLLPGVIDGLIRDGIVEIPVLETSDRWFGITYREDREEVKEKLQKLAENGDYPTPVWK